MFAQKAKLTGVYDDQLMRARTTFLLRSENVPRAQCLRYAEKSSHIEQMNVLRRLSKDVTRWIELIENPLTENQVCYTK
ncbi:hypothetical protein MRB53_038327 [Persea americana]|nr:hypothetical protein MRB53_038327 [Persea americana]